MIFLKKIISAFSTILLISLILFMMFQIIPGSPIVSKLGSEGIDRNPELAKILEEKFMMNKTPLERYFIWIKNLLRGDMGNSFKYETEVSTLISERFVPTIVLTVLSMIITVAISIPLGIFVSQKSSRKSAAFYNILGQLGIAIPVFFLAIVLLWLFSIKIKIFPTRAFVDLKKPAETLKSLVLPVIVLSFGNISAAVRQIQNGVEEEKRKQYVRFYKAQGLSDEEILKNHILRNILISVITMYSLIFIGMIMGSIFIENIFNIQGIGSLLINAIKDRDLPVVQGIVFIYSVIVVLMNLILDFLFIKIDPRIAK